MPSAFVLPPFLFLASPLPSLLWGFVRLCTWYSLWELSWLNTLLALPLDGRKDGWMEGWHILLDFPRFLLLNSLLFFVRLFDFSNIHT